jgi:hypothetical protein|tara:strand:+ start:6129 stop:6353 length:225 start_codon:yes stop_codon:yes gene_type:complete
MIDDLNCGDIVCQTHSGRLGVVLKLNTNLLDEDSKQLQFNWCARVLWTSNKANNDFPLGREDVLIKSLNMISKA